MPLEIWQCSNGAPHPAHNYIRARSGRDANDPRLPVWRVQCMGVAYVEEHAESEYAQELQRRREYTEGDLDAVDSHKPMAAVIWNASRQDEGTISATGADIVAKALIMAGYGKLSQERPQEPRLVVDGVEQDPADPESWRISREPLMLVPEPEPLIDYAALRQAIQDGIANGISEAEIWKRNRG